MAIIQELFSKTEMNVCPHTISWSMCNKKKWWSELDGKQFPLFADKYTEMMHDFLFRLEIETLVWLTHQTLFFYVG